VVSRLLFTTPAFDGIAEIEATWSLVRGVADALFALALLVIGVAVMVRGGSDAQYSAKVLVPRLVLAAALANASLTFCGGLVTLLYVLVHLPLAACRWAFQQPPAVTAPTRMLVGVARRRLAI